MRESIIEFARMCSETLNIQSPIYEIGASISKEQQKLPKIKSFFENKEYISSDVAKTEGIDICLDAENLALEDESCGAIIFLDAIEHVENPQVAMKEIYRVLKKDGILIMSSVMNFPIHNYPSDYWRFTPSCFRHLMKEFNCCVVDWLGEDNFPHTIVGIGFKGKNEDLNILNQEIAKWKKKKYGNIFRRIAYILFSKKYNQNENTN